MKLANEENVELSDEQLEFLAGGSCLTDCGSYSKEISKTEVKII